MKAPQQNSHGVGSDDGGVTLEFVVIFPLLFLFLILIIFVSMMISTASDVQQLAHELSRQALGRLSSGATIADVCQQMATDSTLMNNLIAQTVLVDANKLAVLPCPGQPSSDGYITVKLTYNFAGSLVQALGQNLGVDLGVITRSSTVRL